MVVSTTAAQDPSTDAAEAALREVFDQDGGGRWTVSEAKIVSDVVTHIQQQIMLWADDADPVNLIVTSGGTGFAVEDHTPEAVIPLLHKQAPGLVHGMLAASLAVTPFAVMSRPVAGVRNKTVIITLPGSPKAAKENLQAVIKTLPHACLQAAGASSRALHSGGVKKLEQEAGMASPQAKTHSSHSRPHHHHHHCPHGHQAPIRHTPTPAASSTSTSTEPKSNDPSLGPTRRHRSSPYPMLSVSDALSLIAQHVPKPTPILHKVDPSLVGYVAAEDVHAAEDVPAFRASIVDGYAVVVPDAALGEEQSEAGAGADLKGVWPVVGVSHASPTEEFELKEGQVARITTGAALPRGANAVVMVEDTVLAAQTEDGTEEKEVGILAEGVKAGDNVREVGSDVRKGEIVLRKGERVSSGGGEIGLLASVGIKELMVYAKPVVGVLSTGDEIVEHDKEGDLRLGEVRDINRPSLMAAVRQCGYDVIDLGIVKDKARTLEEKLRVALREVDVVITTGGVSMGELDLLKPTIERSLGGTIHFGRVNMKPGKPTTFATVPVKNNAGERVSKVIFALPGNPASALVTFHLFVLPALHHMSGVSPPGLPKVPVTLAHDFVLDKARPEYHRAVVSIGSDGRLTASSTGSQRSSRVGSMKQANALLCMPSGSEPLRKGTRVEALLMGNIQSNAQ